MEIFIKIINLITMAYVVFVVALIALVIPRFIKKSEAISWHIIFMASSYTIFILLSLGGFNFYIFKEHPLAAALVVLIALILGARGLILLGGKMNSGGANAS